LSVTRFQICHPWLSSHARKVQVLRSWSNRGASARPPGDLARYFCP
jgi:hypothetical protein